MQAADLHLSTGTGHCRDEQPVGYNGGKCEADPRTLEFVGKLLDEEKPDLVILSGDQINGETAPDAQSVSSLFNPICETFPDFSRRYLNMRSCSSSEKSHTQRSSAITTMKDRYLESGKCL